MKKLIKKVIKSWLPREWFSVKLETTMNAKLMTGYVVERTYNNANLRTYSLESKENCLFIDDNFIGYFEFNDFINRYYFKEYHNSLGDPLSIRDNKEYFQTLKEAKEAIGGYYESVISDAETELSKHGAF